MKASVLDCRGGSATGIRIVSLRMLLVVCLVLIYLGLFTRGIGAGSIEYLQLRAKGDSMYPTIEDGDHVTVKLGVSASLISEGDIIVYGTIAALSYNPNPDSMFIGHRVIEKYEDRGTWYFKTQGDNCPEPDPYTVPDYFVLGVVVDITSPPTPADDKPGQSASPAHQSSTYIDDVPIGLWLGGGSLALVIVIRATFHFKNRQEPEVQIHSLKLQRPRDFIVLQLRPALSLPHSLRVNVRRWWLVEVQIPRCR